MAQQAFEREADNLVEDSLENVNYPELPEFVAAHDFFEVEEHEQLQTIKKIVTGCLRDIRKLRTIYLIDD